MSESNEDVLRLRTAESEARRMMRAWGLRGWEFRFNRRRQEVGACIFPSGGRPGRIELSRWFVLLNPWWEILDTVRHEIAHALAGPYHDTKWKRMCAILGATPERTCSARMPAPPWTATCPTCGHAFGRYRPPSPKHNYYCPRCPPNPQHALSWQRSTR